MVASACLSSVSASMYFAFDSRRSEMPSGSSESIHDVVSSDVARRAPAISLKNV